MIPKLLLISTEHGERGPQVIGQYEDGFRNFVVVMRALKMKRVDDGDAVLTMNN